VILAVVYGAVVGLCYVVYSLSSTDRQANLIASVLWPLSALVGAAVSALFAVSALALWVAVPVFVASSVVRTLVRSFSSTIQGRW